MHDQKVLASCLASKEAYDKIKGHVTKAEFSPQSKVWWELLDSWYKKDPDASHVDIDTLISTGKRSIHEKHYKELVDYLKSLPEPGSPTNVVLEALELKRFNSGMVLATSISNNEPAGRVLKDLDEYAELLRACDLTTGDQITAGGLAELDSYFDRDNLIKLSPAIMNERTGGGAQRGDHILIFARPEVGKTLFTVNLVAGFLRQKLRILYVGNEDKIQKIQKRIRSNLANMPDAFLERPGGVDEANRRAGKFKMDEYLTMVHMHPGTVSEIESLLQSVTYDVVVIDQIINLRAKADGKTAQLEQIARDTRALFGKYNVLGVTTAQQGAPPDGRPKIILNQDDIFNSKTGLPAQTDLLLGLGADEEMLDRNEWRVNICRNKLNGNHEAVRVKFNKDISKVY